MTNAANAHAPPNYHVEFSREFTTKEHARLARPKALTGKEDTLKTKLEGIGLTAYTNAEITAKNYNDWTVLVVGDLNDDAIRIISKAKAKDVPILNDKWLDATLKIRRYKRRRYIYRQESRHKSKHKPEHESRHKSRHKSRQAKAQKESSFKQEPVDEPILAEGPNKVERDPVRREWYDAVEDGPYTITLAVHPADVLNNAPIKRRNYVMWIERIYSYYFMVTDP